MQQLTQILRASSTPALLALRAKITELLDRDDPAEVAAYIEKLATA